MILLFFKRFIDLFTYFGLCWNFLAVSGLSLVMARGAHLLPWCMGGALSCFRAGLSHFGSPLQYLWHVGSVSQHVESNQGSDPCPLHWQADMGS